MKRNTEDPSPEEETDFRLKYNRATLDRPMIGTRLPAHGAQVPARGLPSTTTSVVTQTTHHNVMSKLFTNDGPNEDQTVIEAVRDTVELKAPNSLEDCSSRTEEDTLVECPANYWETSISDLSRPVLEDIFDDDDSSASDYWCDAEPSTTTFSRPPEISAEPIQFCRLPAVEAGIPTDGSAPSGSFPQLNFSEGIMDALRLSYFSGGFSVDTTTMPLEKWIARAITFRVPKTQSWLTRYMSIASNEYTTEWFTSVKECARAHKRGLNVIFQLLQLDDDAVGFFMGLLGSYSSKKTTYKRKLVRPQAPPPPGEEQQVRVLYYRGYSRVPKPASYEISSFCRWVKGESSYVYAHTRGFIPVVSQAVNALMSGRCVASPREIHHMFMNASVCITQWGELRGSIAAVSSANRSFRVGPITVTSEEELDKLSKYFLPKHKRGYSFLLELFRGGSVNGPQLESVLAKALPPSVWEEALCALAIREGGAMSRDAATALDSPSTNVIGRRLGEGAAEGLHSGLSAVLPSTLSIASRIGSATFSFLTPEFVRNIGRNAGKGLFSSIPPTYFRAAGYDAMKGAIEAAAHTIRESENLWQQVLNAALGIAAMVAAESNLSFYLALLQTLNNDPVARSIATSMFDQLKTLPVRQGSEAETDWIAQAAGLSFFSAIRSFFGEVYQALIPSFLDVCKALKFAGLKEGAAKVAQWLAECVAELGRRIQACIDQRSLNPLLGVDAARWIRHSKGVLEYRDLITAVPVDTRTLQRLVQDDHIPDCFRVHMCQSEFLEAVENHIADGEMLRHLVTPTMKNSYNHVMGMLNGLKADTLANINRNSQRAAPFCVLFCGPPGTGKTMVAQAYARSVALREGRDENSVYSYQSGANFQTGLGAHTTCVCMDDPDAVVMKPNSENHCEFLQRLVNNNPFPVEAADVSEKGKVICRPTDVVITSNTKHLSATQGMTDCGAVWRRIHLWLIPTVKEEFRVPGKDRLDTTKPISMASCCTWDVEEFADAENRTLRTRTLLRGVSYKEAMTFVFNRRQEYLDRQRSLATKASNKCEGCYMPHEGCVCPEPTREGLGAVLAFFKPANRLREHLQSLSQYFSLSSGVGALVGVSASYLVISRVMSTVALTTQGLLAGTPPDGWHRVEQHNPPAMPADSPCTWSFQQMQEQVALQMVKIHGVPFGGSDMSGVIYTNGWVLFPTHAFGAKGVVEIEYRDSRHKVRKDHCRLYYNAELCLVYVSGLTGSNGIRVYVQTAACTSAQSLADGVLIGPRMIKCGRVDISKQHNFPAWKYANVTEAGDCGHVLGALGPGGKPRIFGVHIFAVEGLWSKAVEIDQTLLDGVVLQATSSRVLTQGCFVGNLTESAPLKHFPAKSEILVSRTFWNNNAICWGMYAVAGRTVKTAFKETSFHNAVKRFAQDRDIFLDYAPPEFRGGMVDGVYTSPYTHALRDSNRSTTTYMDCVDYLVDRLKGHWGSFLSEEEAFRGVPGEFNSINIRSSMGPPHGGPKTKHITADRFYMSPELRATLDEIESTLARREVPRVMAEAVLKDEILKVGKTARVFCMVAAAFNIACKRRFAILKRSMRSSFGTSECCVGIDMGSRSCEDIVRVLQSRRHIYSMDCSRMDKMWTPECWDAVAEVIRRVTQISAGEQAGFEAWALVMAMKEAIICVKGDFFTAFWNISGNDITVELNSILLSLMLEKTRRFYGIEFVTLTYGDDNINVSDQPLPEDFFLTFTEITGFQVTDANKNTTPRAEALTEVSFLKRTFRYDSEYECWCAPLSESSIVKMLLFRGKSTLSPTDHEDELVDAANRYAILLGRERYNQWRALLVTLTRRELLDYDVAMTQYSDGTFSDWCAREVVHDGSPLSTFPLVEYQGSSSDNMEQSSTNALANESVPLTTPSDNAPVPVGDPQVLADTVTVITPTDTLAVGTSPAFRSYQEPPVYDLGAFPERWVQLARYKVSSANNPGTTISGFDVTAALLSNPAFSQKRHNFRYWKGDIEIMGVWNVPGNASGAYAAVAYPRVSGDNMGAARFETCMSYERSVLLPVSSSVDFLLECPFFSDKDAETSPPYCSWWLSLFCLSPVKTAQAEGVSEGWVTIFARFKPGYKFMTPTWEGKNSTAKRIIQRGQQLQQSKVISSTASSIAEISEKLTKVPIIGGAAAAVNSVASSAALIADWLGFSRKNEQGATNIIATRSVTNVALTDGKDAADICGFSVANALDMDPGILGGETEDPMSFESMSNRWIAVSSFDWASSNTPSTILASIPVTPGFHLPGIQQTFTGAGYCGLPFEYWRADAEYCIVIPASALHRGALQVLYHPQPTGPSAGDNPTNQGMSAILDVSSSTVFNVKVGYAVNQPMLPLMYFSGQEPIVPVNSSNGYLQIRVLNSLVSQNPIDSFKVWVFVRFKNVQFAVPRTKLRYYIDTDETVANQWELAVQLQGFVPGDGDAGDSTDVELVPGTGDPYPTHGVVSGENIRSLRALAQRPTRLIHPPDDEPTLIGYGGFTPSNGWYDVTTTAALALAPFVLSAASERIKWIGEPAYVGAAAVVLQSADRGEPVEDEVYSSMPMTFAGPQQGAEFHIPYYFPARGRRLQELTDPPASGRVVSVTRNPRGPYEVYYSLGDDIRVGHYGGFPVINYVKGQASYDAFCSPKSS